VIAGFCLLVGAGAALPWEQDSTARLIVASVLLYAAGMSLNDHADRNQDAKLRPERPIPSGQITPSMALILGMTCLGASLLMSPIFYYHAIMGGLILGYDYVIKRNAGAGALTMGALRGMNLLSPCALGASGFEKSMAFEAGAGYALYIIAVTFLGILEDSDRVKRKTVLGLVLVPPIVVTLVIYALPERWPASAIAITLALWFLWRQRGVGVWNQGAIRGAMMHLLLGTMLYTSLIALGTGHWIEALIIVAMLLLARLVARSISLT